MTKKKNYMERPNRFICLRYKKLVIDLEWSFAGTVRKYFLPLDEIKGLCEGKKVRKFYFFKGKGWLLPFHLMVCDFSISEQCFGNYSPHP